MIEDDRASWWLHVSETERVQLVAGIVSANVKAMAASVAAEAFQERWNANAGKPTTTKIRRRARERSVGAPSSRTASKAEGL